MSNAPDVRHILVIEDQKSKRIVALKNNNYTIGRDPNASIILYDRQVSRHHATLVRITDYQSQQTIYRIIDGNLQGKKSTNGLIINDKYSLSHELKSGDIIRFGSSSKASYHLISSAAEAAALKSSESADKSTESGFNLSQSKEVNQEFMENTENINTIIFQKFKEKNSLESSSENLSLDQFNPNPLVELNYDGEITYINAAASRKFPDLEQKKLEHQILKGLLKGIGYQETMVSVRELEIDEHFYEQHISYIAEKKLIRSYLFEVTKYKRLESQLTNNLERYNFLVEQISEGIFLVNIKTKKIIDANLGVCELLGYQYDEIIQLNLYQIIALDRNIIDTELQKISENYPYLIDESLYRCQDGTLISVKAKISRNQYNGQEIFSFSVQDISERKRTEEKMQYEAFHDSLTNLPNRKLFYQQLYLTLTNAKKNQTIFGVIFLDIDSFKNINNSLGHSVGDQLLESFAQRLISCTRTGDTVARWGSDDFTILLPRLKNPEENIKISQKILDDLKQPFVIGKHQLQVKVSIGIAIYPQDGEDEETLLKNAAVALTKTKEQGKNSYQFYTPIMSSEAALLLKLENAIHKGLERREFSVYYQPQIKWSSGEVTAMEALLRWEVPEIGLIPPSKLFAKASKTDLILQITQWILQTACEQNLAWQEAGLPPVPIAVNLSAREFQNPYLVETVARILQKTRLDPHWLELELTEKILRQNLRAAPGIFQDFHNLGIRLALDDFGIGFSSIGYLKQFRFRTLKIHQSFIRDLRGTSQEAALISALVTLGRGFNLRVVAEGVETPSQLELLKTLECEEVQGYLLSRPLRASEATPFLTQRAAQLNR
ncbi:EAL domain-containing protein [Gloeothece verrucosa]|uniref:Diguanylate cyclase/phosphodiesterase with PAS/PAC sensor(S) n=1 Tax=Gloeothece verrucosa (strain PCC 7822) TaxID=497965 RepID=E0UI84_GLOV7|nr:EAL domain-containing protein [Gloeothece verrucosa]ADN15736.1 diguanylate cyclase/phosphodiesterase with PAS/PAC sensor(s) [Gloeothece verrucosa PCC 7822]